MKYFFSALVFVFAFAGILNAQQQQTTVFKTPQEAVRYYENLVENLTKIVTGMQDDTARMDATIRDLQSRVAALTSSNQALSQEVAKLKSQVAADAEVREAQLEKIANKLSQPASVPASSAATEYEIYEVQPGATLSAISKAYGVSVQAIKDSNNMKNDVLRVGQKLKIPVSPR